MKRKQIVSTLLAMAMTTAMVLSGCGGGGDDASSSSSAKTDANSTSETSKSEDDSSSGDRVKITYAQWGNESETAATQAVADMFNKSQDKIEVEVIKIDHDTYVTKLNTMATAGELPDTAIMSEAGVLGFAANGMLADVSSMYGEGDDKPMESTAFKYEGNTVAYGAAHNVLNMYYNIDLLKEVCEKQNLDISTVTPPASADDAWDWDTFVEIAQKLTIDVMPSARILMQTMWMFTDVPSIHFRGSLKFGHCPMAADTTAKTVPSVPLMMKLQ